jgi:SAM-dependent methyltransferase
VTNLIPRIEFSIQALFLRQRMCPFCQTADHAIVARKYGVIRIRRCKTCFLYFTDPIYRSRIGDLYESLYRAEGSTTVLPDRHQRGVLTATNFTLSDKNCAPQIDALKRLGVGRTLLEVGSSWGYFLYQANTAGFTAVGVEPGRTRREYGVRELGLDIKDSMHAFSGAEFDVIYSAHTLEHISDVSGFFVACSERLVPGGSLVVEVPHVDLSNLGKRVVSMIGAIHPLGLSRSFFGQALPTAGFEMVGVYDSWANVPSSPVTGYREGVLIVVARKPFRRPR